MAQPPSRKSDASEGWKPRPIADPRVGTLAEGRYRILRRLGEGGMGIVYQAENERVRRKVALKTLRVDLASDGAAVERFQREAFAATAIGDRHIVEVLDMGQLDDGTPFLVMELLEGEDLGAYLTREGPLPVSRVLSLLRPLCRALGRAHEAGIVHRDIKPSNLMLCRDGDDELVKVLDFGISKMRSDAQISLTREGQRLGTPAFAAPEQWSGAGEVDARADLYALGVLVFVMLTGSTPPLENGSVSAAHVASALCGLRPDLPVAVGHALSRMLAKDPDGRPATCAELYAIFCEAASAVRDPDAVPARPLGALAGATTQPTRAAGPSVPAAVPVQRTPHRWLVGMALFAALIALGWLAWGLRSPPTGAPALGERGRLAPASRGQGQHPVAQDPEPHHPSVSPEPSVGVASPPVEPVKASAPSPVPRVTKRRTKTPVPAEPAPPAPVPSEPLVEPPEPQSSSPEPTKTEPPAPSQPDPLRRGLIPIEL